MTRTYSRVTRRTAAFVLSGTGAPVLLVIGAGLGVFVLQNVLRYRAGPGRIPAEDPTEADAGDHAPG